LNTLFDIEQNEVFQAKISPSKSDVKNAIIQAKRAAVARERIQTSFLASDLVFKSSILAKLREVNAEQVCSSRNESWFGNFERCGIEKSWLMCESCERAHEITYSCSQRFCPNCAWKVALKRKKFIEALTDEMYSVKHVVLTQKNFAELKHTDIVQSRKNLFDLRRKKVFGKVTGGCASLEFTNEDTGWHMHWHLLLQSGWIEADKLSIAWGKLVNQTFAIVKIKDVSEKSYVQEVCKYVAKGSEIAGWKPQQILDFIVALRDTRTFSTFGKFRELAKFARLKAESEKPETPACECGGTDYVFGEDESACRRIIRKLHGG
jgi:hypothetical protein